MRHTQMSSEKLSCRTFVDIKSFKELKCLDIYYYTPAASTAHTFDDRCVF